MYKNFLKLLLIISFTFLYKGIYAEKSNPSILKKAVFAGGCFWCMEPPFDKLYGVISTTSGYTGGTKENPTYEEVSFGYTGHAESIQIEYDSTKISYKELLKVFWKNIDPFAKDYQFCDHGNQYRSAIFYNDETEKKIAIESLEELKRKFKTIETEIVPLKTFYPAEEYHQDFYLKNPIRYKYYRYNCGRDKRLQEIWGE